jgi:hypothetical protein
MKILYLITVNQKDGIGGHYYSLKATIDLVKQLNNCVIVNIGRNQSAILSSMSVPVYDLLYSRNIFSFRPLLKQLNRLMMEEKPDIIHAFDKQSLFFGMLFSKKFQKPLIVTRCGGEDPIYYPNIENIIVYSLENKRFFESKNIAKNIFFIPNRISRPEQDLVRIAKIRKMINNGSRIFLRIARMSDLHKYSIIQSENLIKRLNSDGVKAQLIIVGVIRNQKIFEEVLDNKDENIILLTNDEYTHNASALIDVAEFIIGAGRSFMEAASLQKIMLCPVMNSDIPLLITPENFKEAFKRNFSSRVSIAGYDEEKNYRKIFETINDDNYLNYLKIFSGEVSKKYFEIESQREIFQNIYISLTYTDSIHTPDLIFQAILLLINNSIMKQK